MPKVYVANQSGHDISPARAFGEIVVLTEGLVNRFALNTLFREIYEKVNESTPEDFLLLAGPSPLVALVSSAFAWRHGHLNLLIYNAKNHIYEHRRITFKEMLLRIGEENETGKLDN